MKAGLRDFLVYKEKKTDLYIYEFFFYKNRNCFVKNTYVLKIISLKEVIYVFEPFFAFTFFAKSIFVFLAIFAF